MTQEELIEKAIEARKLSYSPYSHFAVGSALLCKDGSVYLGANVENASYPLCVCGERNALYHAMMEGKTREDFAMIAIVADSEGPCSPCGACRQVLSELFPKDSPIVMANLKGDIRVSSVDELLPYAFDDSDL